jgi:maltose alpha-D-glucosyltransferase/alpha-amylase
MSRSAPPLVRGSRREKDILALADDPLWYKDAIVYELHVRAFHDSAGDGVGDFRGLAEKLDYLKDLGVTAIWLLPFYPSPLRDDGYDISDYTSVHPAYGALADFRLLLKEAHRRGLRVITELVLNHTSDQHPWFQQARRAAPGSPKRNFYVWSDTPERYKEARIIFKDFESSNWSWDPVAGAYYWHRFYAHQPDLNWDSPAVLRAMLRVLDFWLEMGVDGVRLDAVPYLYERDGTSCENLPETHATLRALRRHIEKKFKNRMLLAEANQWPEDAVAYFGQGDETHMAFHFPLMPRMFMALRMEDRYPIIDILAQTPAIPESCQWALFLRNHDELTLEMVTDEERDYMYRVYANDPQARINLGIRRRLAPLLGNDRRQIELMTALLLAMPGTPVLYYGDELGMGDNIFLGDRNGVRTPMQWSADRNAGFSRANPQRLYLPVIIDPDFTYESVNVQAQQDNPNSLLWWTKRMIALRKRFKAFGRGAIEFLYPSNRKVLAFLRRYEREQVLVVANLSRHAQFVELDLRALRDFRPVETFGGSYFPVIGERPYLLTLGPHSFYWLELRPPSAATELKTAAAAAELPRLSVPSSWEELFQEGPPAGLEGVLPSFIATRPWFDSPGRPIQAVSIVDAATIPYESRAAHVVIAKVEFAEGDPETYVLTLGFAGGEHAGRVRSKYPRDIIARLEAAGEEGVVYCALRDKDFTRAVLDAISRRRRFRSSQAGELLAVPAPSFRRLRGAEESARASLHFAGRGESSVFYADRLAFKWFRRFEPGPNPDLEVGSYLTEKVSFPHVPDVVGHLEYRPGKADGTVVAVLKRFVPNEGNAWQLALDGVGRYLEQVLARRTPLLPPPLPSERLLDLSAGELPALAHELIGTYLEPVRLLGRRTGELHIALASSPDDPVFAPEAFTPFYQRSLYQSLRNLTQDVFDMLRRSAPSLPADAHADADKAAGLQNEILKRMRAILDRPIAALRTRIHGDYHLGHALWTGRDFMIIDFQGQTARPLSTRRLKRSPLLDVASMIGSFRLAAHQGLVRQVQQGGIHVEATASLELWAHYWSLWVCSAFLRAYLRACEGAPFLPKSREDVGRLLFLYKVEDALSELRHFLLHRRDWVRPTVQSLVRFVEGEPRPESQR